MQWVQERRKPVCKKAVNSTIAREEPSNLTRVIDTPRISGTAKGIVERGVGAVIIEEAMDEVIASYKPSDSLAFVIDAVGSSLG